MKKTAVYQFDCPQMYFLTTHKHVVLNAGTFNSLII